MVQRWTFYDPVTTDLYTVPLNPSEMSSIHAPRNITGRTTTAIDGAVLVTEGNRPAHQWSFSGAILNSTHYAELLDWTNRPNRIIVTDHYGRAFEVVFSDFAPTPKRSAKHYWRHEYTISALIVSTPTTPTVGLDP